MIGPGSWVREQDEMQEGGRAGNRLSGQGWPPTTKIYTRGLGFSSQEESALNLVEQVRLKLRCLTQALWS